MCQERSAAAETHDLRDSDNEHEHCEGVQCRYQESHTCDRQLGFCVYIRLLAPLVRGHYIAVYRFRKIELEKGRNGRQHHSILVTLYAKHPSSSL